MYLSKDLSKLLSTIRNELEKIHLKVKDDKGIQYMHTPTHLQLYTPTNTRCHYNDSIFRLSCCGVEAATEKEKNRI